MQIKCEKIIDKKYHIRKLYIYLHLILWFVYDDTPSS